MSISKSLRFQILRRDGHACRYCGRSAPDVALNVDHVTPVALGGLDEPSNLVTACGDCNNGKSATPPDAALIADVAEDAARWAQARAAASERLATTRQQRNARRDWFLNEWNGWTYRDVSGHQQTVPLPDNWAATLDRFHEAGLTADDIGEAIDLTMRAAHVEDRFRYFCAIGWTTVRALDEHTRAILDGHNDQEAP